MGSSEDCASVLEQFIHDVANLPAEISHMMEEIQAKDVEMQRSMSMVNQRDAALQKQIKLNGSLLAHPKEAEFSEVIRKHYALASEIQSQKVALSEKACRLLERQIRGLDVKIRDLQTDGQLVADGLPSVFNRKQFPDAPKPFTDLPLPVNSALQVVTNNALNMNAAVHRINNQINPQIAQAVSRQISQVTANAPVRSSAPATPSSNLAQHQRHRESSAGASDIKRRKLNNTSFTANLPAQPSSLRQSSLGPGASAAGTPKPGTPTGTSASAVRSGSLPRTLSSQQIAIAAAKKSGLSKNVAPHQQISKLKGKAMTKHARLSTSGAGRKKGVSPSVRSRAGGDDDDSVLSSADPSDTDSQHASKHRGRRSKKDKAAQAMTQTSVSDHEEVEDDDDQEDDRRYCFCNERSYGEMVACENEKCTYEWFHLACIGLKKAPDDKDIWYCPACRKDFVKEEKKGK